MKTILIVMLSSVLMGAGSCGNAPKMKKKVRVWNGAPEEGGVCRAGPTAIGVKLGLPEHFSKMVFETLSDDQPVCMSATDPVFKTYGCMTFEDMGVIQEYIATLLLKCSRWRK